MNKNMLPGDTSAVKPSGIRLGTPEMTRLGMGKDAMMKLQLIHLLSEGMKQKFVKGLKSKRTIL